MGNLLPLSKIVLFSVKPVAQTEAMGKVSCSSEDEPEVRQAENSAVQCLATQECCEGELPTSSVLAAHNEGRPTSPALPQPGQLHLSLAADLFWVLLAHTGPQLLQKGHPKAAASIQSNKPGEGVVKKTAKEQKDVLYLSFFVWKSGQSPWRTHCWSWGQRGSS